MDRLIKLSEDNILKQHALDKKAGVGRNTKSGSSAQAKPKSSVATEGKKRRRNSSIEGSRHYYIVVKEPETKFDALMSIFDTINKYTAIVYCNQVKDLNKNILKSQVSVMGSKRANVYKFTKAMKSGVLDWFKEDEHNKVLITRDHLLRGHFVDADLVINFDLPDDFELYCHRIGLNKGVVLSIVTEEEFKILRGFDVPMNILPKANWWAGK